MSDQITTNQAEIEPATHKIVASIQTDPGCVREVNEDSGKFIQPSDPQLLTTKGLLAIVADGLGGHLGGEVASKLAVEVISRAYYQEDGDPCAALKKAFKEANRQIYEAALQDQDLKGMGTTGTALVLLNDLAYAAHVGDSRLYMLRGGEIYLLTEDHSAVMEMVKYGIITMEEARHHVNKNVILRALGTNSEVEVSTWKEPLPVQTGDYFLLCSDGLYDMVEDEEIKQVVLSLQDPHAACENLIALAKERGGYDNITVGIINIRI